MERSSETRTNDGGDGGDDARGGSTRLSFDRGCLNLTRMMSASSARAEVCRVSSGLSEFIGVVTTVDAPIDDQRSGSFVSGVSSAAPSPSSHQILRARVPRGRLSPAARRI
jgi:hypothetical protein